MGLVVDDAATRMVELAHERQFALRLEVSALEAAVAGDHQSTSAKQAAALVWLSEYAAKRILQLSKELEDARAVPDHKPAQGPTGPSAQSPQPGGVPPFAVITGGKPRASRK